jgi:hypothetical protein
MAPLIFVGRLRGSLASTRFLRTGCGDRNRLMLTSSKPAKNPSSHCIDARSLRRSTAFPAYRQPSRYSSLRCGIHRLLLRPTCPPCGRYRGMLKPDCLPNGKCHTILTCMSFTCNKYNDNFDPNCCVRPLFLARRLRRSPAPNAFLCAGCGDRKHQLLTSSNASYFCARAAEIPNSASLLSTQPLSKPPTRHAPCSSEVSHTKAA